MQLEIGDVADVVAKALDDATGPLLARIAALEQQVKAMPVPIPGRDGLPGVPGPAGRDGERGPMGEKGLQGSEGPVGPPGEPGPAGPPGEPGERGERGEPGAIGEKGERGEAGPEGSVGEQGPVGPIGEKGDPGLQGPAGERGQDAPPVTQEQVIEAVKAMPEVLQGVLQEVVTKHFEAHPVEHGKDGRDGVDGVPGRDGVHLAGAVIGKDGDLVLTLSDGTVRSLGVVIGKDGAPGAPGRDGFGFDDFEEEFDGDRTIIRRYRRGDEVKEFRFTFPIVLDRGVFDDEKAYVRGDGVTYGGSFWIAQDETKGIRPGLATVASRVWRLAVKVGRDGKPGAPGKDGKDGKAPTGGRT